MPIVYRTHGKNSVTVALIPSICHERLVVFSANNSGNGWAIRDFITNRILEDEHSVARTRAIIEAEINTNYSEYPPFYDVEHPTHAPRWELYLVLRTIAHHRRNNRNINITPPMAVAGDTWNPIQPEPPWTPLTL